MTVSHGVGCTMEVGSAFNTFRRLLFGFVVVVLSYTYALAAQEFVENNPALFEATFAGDVAKVESILNNGANPNVSNANGMTSLMYASMGRQADTVGQRSSFNSSCNIDVMRLLLQRGANPNAAADNGYTAIIAAAGTSNIECIKLLLNAGANVNVKTKQGSTALREATLHGQLKTVVLLIQAGAHLDDTDENGRTPLLNAISNSVPGSSAASPYETIAIVLLQAGANANISDRNGQSPITLAATMDATVVAYPLLEHHANVNAVDPTAGGATPLIIAADHGNAPLVKELLRYHPDLNRHDLFGKTALEYAKEKKQAEIVDLLTRAIERQ